MKKFEYNPYLIDKIQPCGGIIFKDNYIKKGDGYEACINIYDYPSEVNHFWLKGLIKELDDTVITVDVGTANINEVLKKVNKSMNEHNSRIEDSRDYTTAINSNNEFGALSALTDDIVNNSEVMKQIVTRIFVWDRTLEGLENKEKNILEKLETLKYKGAIFINEQEYEWKSIKLPMSKQEKLPNGIIKQPIQALSLAGGYPFDFIELKDKTGMPLGTTRVGGSVIFDLFTKNSIRKSFNALILGVTGAGKSTLLKKLMNNNIILEDTIRVLDLTGEFGETIERSGGKVIKLDGSNGMINPFQIFATMIDTDTNEILEEQSYMFHINKLSMTYRFLAEGCSSEEIREFENLVNDFYIDFGIKRDKCTTYKVKEYPIMEEFLNFIKEQLYNNVEKEELKTNLTTKRQERIESIKLTIENAINNYSKLFNGYSTIEDMSSERILSFELRNLSQFDNRIFNAQMFSILTMLWNGALKQGIKQKKLFDSGAVTLDEATKYLLFIDEAHKYINSDNELAVDFFITFEREARKYFSGLVFATHSINDVVPESSDKTILGKIKTLFELTQYKFIMQQDNNAKKALETIFEGQLNENEINNIPTFGQGDTTLIINGMNNITFHVEISEEEKILFEGGV
ncbi:VirB4 family type IV secretion system protein [Clostridium perfringens]|uniref:VirB4 family type IV secretion system protein n=1 Tax=Clostridium perfringens TaxID=1502 RepID=UPI003A10359D